MTEKSNKPNKHHFLPVFYLRQWAGLDGKIVRFTKPHGGVVKPRRVHPDGAGYIERLYAIQGVPVGVKEDLETEFLSPVDSRAADALRALVSGVELTDTQRIAWAGFIATLLFRMPADVFAMRRNMIELFDGAIPRLEKLYNAASVQGHDPEFEDFSKQIGEKILSEKCFDGMRKFMENSNIIDGLLGLKWSVIATEKSKYDLLTSDRPVIHENGFNNIDSCLVLPVGPRKIFIAVKDQSVISKIKSAKPDKMVRKINEFVVSNASVTVCDRTDSQLRFVQNKMGNGTQPNLLSRLSDIKDGILAALRIEWELNSDMIVEEIKRLANSSNEQ